MAVVIRAAEPGDIGFLAWVVLAASLPSGDFFVESLRDLKPGRMIFVDEGEDVIVTVYEEPEDGELIRTIYVNGSSYTGSRFFARRYMKTMGHLPLLLSERATMKPRSWLKTSTSFCGGTTNADLNFRGR